MTEPCDLPATEARRLIGTRQLSPVELTESCIARIEAIDPAVNAMVARDFDRARAAARTAEAAVMANNRLAPLHGLPVGVKDLEDTEGLRTTYGSLMFRDNIPRADQHIVASVRAAGSIILGKTNTPEFGAGANTRNMVYGATGNPFDPAKSAAGSSGGSAVALATSMVPLATGSDMGGSLRNPAAFNGIVGMRPSPGLFPSEKRQLGPSGLSVLGPMARSASDLALMFEATASHDPRDMLSTPLTTDAAATRAAADLGTIRAAFSPDFGFAPTSKQTRALFADRAQRLAPLFATAEDATPDCRHADDTFAILRAVNFLASFGATYHTNPERLGPNVRTNVEEGLRYTAADTARALHQQTALYQAFQRFFETSDILITPAVTIQPRPWAELFPAEIDGVATRSYYHWLALAYAVTLAGHPAISIPLGTDADGMPFGVQLVGRRHGDRALIETAKAIEAVGATMAPELARPVPDLARLAAARPISESPGFMEMG